MKVSLNWVKKFTDVELPIQQLVEKIGSQLGEVDKVTGPHQKYDKDYIIDIENKMFTHRPDLFGMLGIAREIAGISGKSFKSPNWYRLDASISKPQIDELKLEVDNQLPKLVPRFSTIVIRGVEVKESPDWLGSYLERLGERSINNVVDLTNYLQFETAQPLHAYDYDKVKAQDPETDRATLTIRQPKAGEELNLLDGKTVELQPGAVIIGTKTKAIGLGGVKGGAGTEVGRGTKNIILESATFDMNVTRQTARTYGLSSDAVTRFTKGQSPLQTLPVLARAIIEIQKLAGGQVASPVVDSNYLPKEVADRGTLYPPVELSIDFINSRLGLEMTTAQIAKLLQNVEFEVHSDGDNLSVKAPFWRTDIEIPEDIVEEVGRLRGFDQLPSDLPSRDLTPASLNGDLSFQEHLSYLLTKAGGNQLLTYSFIHSSLTESAGQNPKDAYRIQNALSPNLQYYRLSLGPSLLEKVHANIKLGFDNFMLYELGRAHVKGVLDKEKLPRELKRLAMVFAAEKNAPSGAPYFTAKYYSDYLLEDGLMIFPLTYKPLNSVKDLPPEWRIAAAAYEQSRAAVVCFEKDLLGIIGEPSLKLRGALKLPKSSSMAEFDIESLALHAQTKSYEPLNRYPETSQDITLKIPVSINYEEIYAFIRTTLEKLGKERGYSGWLEPIDIFQPDSDIKHRHITFRITAYHPAKTLTTEETNKLLDKITDKARSELKAERI